MAVQDITTSATTTLWVSETLPATYTEAGFEAVTGWIQVTELSNAGQVGGTTTVTNHIDVSTGKVVKRGGSVNYGQMALTMARHKGADMIALREAFADRQPRAFRIVYPTAVGEQEFFTGVVVSLPTSIGTADQILDMSITIEIDDEVLTVEV